MAVVAVPIVIRGAIGIAAIWAIKNMQEALSKHEGPLFPSRTEYPADPPEFPNQTEYPADPPVIPGRTEYPADPPVIPDRTEYPSASDAALGGSTEFPATEPCGVLDCSTVYNMEGEETEKGIFEANPKHGNTQRGNASPEPTNPQKTLDDSIELPGNTTRRVAVDKETGEFVVFDEHLPGKFHGHTRKWEELDQTMQATLRKEGLVTKKGKIK
ncbi:MAG: hypothetical protein L3J59_13395 [Methylococcaceae bacterium]|nr:hypothetical protein [Methylococcaceae bacterium]